MAKTSLPDRLYSLILRLLPFEFRCEFGSEMELTFRDQHHETKRRSGSVGLLRMWLTTIVDLFRMAPREHAAILGADVSYALRMMRKNPGYTAAAMLILGMAIGVNATIFSAVNSVLLKPLPYAHGGEMVVLRQPAARLAVEDAGFSPQEVADYRRQAQSLSGVVEYHNMTFTLLGRSEAHRVKAGVVSADFFELMGVEPLMGRTFVPEDDRKDAPAVLVVSYEYWQEVEGGDPAIVGNVFQMNDRPHTVIGVLPAIPQYPDENDVYMPTSACPFRSRPAVINNREARMLQAFGRLKAGIPVERSNGDMATISRRLQQAYPKSYPSDSGFTASASLLRSDLTRHARAMLLVLLGAAGFVLLIACANVANLILARMARREQELVIRTAVGAGAGRLLRQLLTESLIMALGAAALGMLLAAGTVKLLAQFAGQFTPRAREISVDGGVLLFAILCASATTVVFGSVAALYSRHDLAGGLKEAARAAAERSRRFTRSALIAAQVAFSFVLLIGAGLMVRSFLNLNRVNPGFVPQRVLAVGFNLNWSRYTTPAQRIAFNRRLLERIQGESTVMYAAVASSFPLDPENTGGGEPPRLRLEGETRSQTEWPAVDSARSASPDYFQTLGIPLLAGRAFRDSDSEGAEPVVILNRRLAAAGFKDRDPLGRKVSLDGEHWARVVGVVGDTKDLGLSRDTPFQAYLPLAQSGGGSVLLVRTAGDTAGIAGAARRVIHDLDPETAIRRVKTMEETRAESLASPRTTARLFGLFAALAFAIAVTGIGCMLALWVRQRTREIGIRMALGARPRDILASVLRQGMLLVMVGLGAGLAGATVLTRFLKTFLFQVDPGDTTTYFAVSIALVLSALVACLIPATRAARTDPQEALRCD